MSNTNYRGPNLGSLVITGIVVFLVTMGTLFLFTEYQKLRSGTSFETPDGAQEINNPQVGSAIPQLGEAPVPQSSPFVQVLEAPTNAAGNFVPVTGPTEQANVPRLKINVCHETNVYKTTVADPSYLVGFLPVDTEIFLESKSPDGQWFKVHTPGNPVEWWIPIAAFCTE